MKTIPLSPFLQRRNIVILLILFQIFSCNKNDIIFINPHGNFGKDPGEFSTKRTIAPLKITYFSKSSVRASVVINVDGIPVDVLFDTGSWGLRVLAGAIKGAPIDTDSEWVSYPYSGGTNLYGKVAGANLSIANLRSSTPIKIMRIDSISAGSAKYHATGDSTMVNNGLLHGFNGIVGVGLRVSSGSDGVANPLPQLPGAGSFIVHFPKFNDTDGALILNPSEQDLKGFTFINLQPGTVLLPNGYNSWMDNQLKDTLSVGGVPYTSNVLLDSGNPVSFYYKNATSDTAKVSIGTLVKFSLGPPFAASTTFTVSEQQSGLDLVETSNYEVRNVFGIQFFFDFDVCYDQKNGRIGIRKK
ncbi:DUF3443 family protein [Mucilaginibacter sp. E4BP6]|uniref:DUF3443 family protein n=1 Tax=Mucilaginibacter sp. E4BP6 TaxID=2723089 RepID=UPI0015C91E86|nr:DUF3443 family protein [Mucilaginibacter sp. E4BP6]NYE64867.1 hypothetical protein [Mucilaginibacter sp. E4BP6]